MEVDSAALIEENAFLRADVTALVAELESLRLTKHATEDRLQAAYRAMDMSSMLVGDGPVSSLREEMAAPRGGLTDPEAREMVAAFSAAQEEATAQIEAYRDQLQTMSGRMQQLRRENEELRNIAVHAGSGQVEAGSVPTELQPGPVGLTEAEAEELMSACAAAQTEATDMVEAYRGEFQAVANRVQQLREEKALLERDLERSRRAIANIVDGDAEESESQERDVGRRWVVTDRSGDTVRTYMVEECSPEQAEEVEGGYGSGNDLSDLFAGHQGGNVGVDDADSGADSADGDQFEQLDFWGQDFENHAKGYIDLLVNDVQATALRTNQLQAQLQDTRSMVARESDFCRSHLQQQGNEIRDIKLFLQGQAGHYDDDEGEEDGEEEDEEEEGEDQGDGGYVEGRGNYTVPDGEEGHFAFAQYPVFVYPSPTSRRFELAGSGIVTVRSDGLIVETGRAMKIAVANMYQMKKCDDVIALALRTRLDSGRLLEGTVFFGSNDLEGLFEAIKSLASGP